MERTLRRIAAALAVLEIFAAALILLGWQYRVPVLKGEAWGTFIAPNTALCFLLCGLGILLQLSNRRVLRGLGTLLGVLVCLFGAAVLTEYLAQIDLGIDRRFFAHRLSDWNLPRPGRFAINTALGFALAGASLASFRRRGRWVHESFACLVLLLSYLSLLGYLYSASELYGGVMAVHTAALFLVLSIALLCAVPGQLVSETFLRPYAGALAARRIIAAIVLLMPFVGLLQLRGEQWGSFSPEFGTAMSVLLAVILFTILGLHTATVLNDTDRKRRDTETALMKSEKLAAAGRMAASIAHEVNNPLEAVGNLLYLLKSDSLPAETRRKYVDLAEEELNRVAAIARRTLGFYKDDTERTDVHVSELLDAVIEIYRTKLQQKNVSVHKSFEEKALIRARPGEVRQVFANVISNAIDALPDQEGRLEIAVRVRDGVVIADVTDNGHGIKSEDLGRIFEPFFTTKKEFGTGLGLWVSKELVEKNGGRIEVGSVAEAAGSGTTCRLVFPLIQVQESVKVSAAGPH